MGAVVLVDITPRMEFHGARRVVSFMGAHPDGFDTLDAAADVIAQYNRHRARPKNLDGLRKVLQQRDDGRWIWRWDPAFIASNFEFLQGDPATGAKEFGAISDLLIEGPAACEHQRFSFAAFTRRDVAAVGRGVLEVVPHAEAVDVSGTGHMVAGDDNDAFTSAVADFLDRTLNDSSD